MEGWAIRLPGRNLTKFLTNATCRRSQPALWPLSLELRPSIAPHSHLYPSRAEKRNMKTERNVASNLFLLENRKTRAFHYWPLVEIGRDNLYSNIKTFVITLRLSILKEIHVSKVHVSKSVPVLPEQSLTINFSLPYCICSRIESGKQKRFSKHTLHNQLTPLWMGVKRF